MSIYQIGYSLKFIAFGGFVLAIIALYGQIIDPPSGAIIYTIFLGAPSWFLYKLSKSQLITTDSLIELRLSYLGNEKIYQIQWNEIEAIYLNRTTFSFSNQNKQLVLSLFSTKNSDKQKIAKYIESQAKICNIQLVYMPEIISKQVNVEINDRS